MSYALHVLALFIGYAVEIFGALTILAEIITKIGNWILDLGDQVSEQYDLRDFHVTFLCGPNKTQAVELTMGTQQRRITIGEFLDMFIPCLSEANRRRAIELKK